MGEEAGRGILIHRAVAWHAARQPEAAALIADGRHISYQTLDGPPLATPITAFAGTDDTGADGAQMAAWEQQTSAGFRLHTISGGHFAVFDHAAHVQSLITDALQPR